MNKRKTKTAAVEITTFIFRDTIIAAENQSYFPEICCLRQFITFDKVPKYHGNLYSKVQMGLNIVVRPFWERCDCQMEEAMRVTRPFNSEPGGNCLQCLVVLVSYIDYGLSSIWVSTRWCGACCKRSMVGS